MPNSFKHHSETFFQSSDTDINNDSLSNSQQHFEMISLSRLQNSHSSKAGDEVQHVSPLLSAQVPRGSSPNLSSINSSKKDSYYYHGRRNHSVTGHNQSIRSPATRPGVHANSSVGLLAVPSPISAATSRAASKFSWVKRLVSRSGARINSKQKQKQQQPTTNDKSYKPKKQMSSLRNVNPSQNGYSTNYIYESQRSKVTNDINNSTSSNTDEDYYGSSNNDIISNTDYSINERVMPLSPTSTMSTLSSSTSTVSRVVFLNTRYSDSSSDEMEGRMYRRGQTASMRALPPTPAEHDSDYSDSVLDQPRNNQEDNSSGDDTDDFHDAKHENTRDRVERAIWACNTRLEHYSATNTVPFIRTQSRTSSVKSTPSSLYHYASPQVGRSLSTNNNLSRRGSASGRASLVQSQSTCSSPLFASQNGPGNSSINQNVETTSTNSMFRASISSNQQNNLLPAASNGRTSSISAVNTSNANHHNDTASIITIASSTRQRGRRSFDTNASTRAIAPESIRSRGSFDSLPFTLTSAATVLSYATSASATSAGGRSSRVALSSMLSSKDKSDEDDDESTSSSISFVARGNNESQEEEVYNRNFNFNDEEEEMTENDHYGAGQSGIAGVRATLFDDTDVDTAARVENDSTIDIGAPKTQQQEEHFEDKLLDKDEGNSDKGRSSDSIPVYRDQHGLQIVEGGSENGNKKQDNSDCSNVSVVSGNSSTGTMMRPDDEGLVLLANNQADDNLSFSGYSYRLDSDDDLATQDYYYYEDEEDDEDEYEEDEDGFYYEYSSGEEEEEEEYSTSEVYENTQNATCDNESLGSVAALNRTSTAGTSPTVYNKNNNVNYKGKPHRQQQQQQQHEQQQQPQQQQQQPGVNTSGGSINSKCNKFNAQQVNNNRESIGNPNNDNIEDYSEDQGINSDDANSCMCLNCVTGEEEDISDLRSCSFSSSSIKSGSKKLKKRRCSKVSQQQQQEPGNEKIGEANYYTGDASVSDCSVSTSMSNRTHKSGTLGNKSATTTTTTTSNDQSKIFKKQDSLSNTLVASFDNDDSNSKEKQRHRRRRRRRKSSGLVADNASMVVLRNQDDRNRHKRYQYLERRKQCDQLKREKGLFPTTN